MNASSTSDKSLATAAALLSEQISISTGATINISERSIDKAHREVVGRTGESLWFTPKADFIDQPASNRLYPHLHDQSETSGRAMTLVEQALSDARSALDAFDGSDLAAIKTDLALISATAAQAIESSDFNRAFAATLGYVRRATLIADVGEISRPALNALVNTLNRLLQEPTLNLLRAAELTDIMEGNGWKGDDDTIEALVHTLLSEGSDDQSGDGSLTGQHGYDATESAS